VISKFFAAYGIAAVLDPLLVIIIDLIYHNYNCTASSPACKVDYTSTECDCFNGDFLKLWYRMEREEGSGLTGLFITMLLYMGTIIIGCLMLYQYIVYVHRDGRILDQWRRLNGTDEEFFVPDDFEVSDEELKAIIFKGECCVYSVSVFLHYAHLRFVLCYVALPAGYKRQHVQTTVGFLTLTVWHAFVTQACTGAGRRAPTGA
jgi:hypothetical protein